ncbi:MAG: 16S rRNA (guanine(527)-N(7))-methyltransferase RsmG [Proteobacteria bacterium]|nr:16S rRNA (guanine(527)-N(7))-methyltransferase RsmG [Pseudomonadota bacterium]
MVDSTPPALLRAIRSEAERLRHPLEHAQAERLGRLLQLLSHWAQRIRLTGSADSEQLVRRHLADALMLAAALPLQRTQHCLDVGSGGGLPALPTAVLRPELEITLVEPQQRKCAFLRTAIHALALEGCRVLQQRLEQASLGPINVAWSLATFSPDEWLRRALPLLAPGGLAVAFVVRPEVVAAPPAGLVLCATHRYTLADDTPRALLVLRREEAADARD